MGASHFFDNIQFRATLTLPLPWMFCYLWLLPCICGCGSVAVAVAPVCLWLWLLCACGCGSCVPVAVCGGSRGCVAVALWLWLWHAVAEPRACQTHVKMHAPLARPLKTLYFSMSYNLNGNSVAEWWRTRAKIAQNTQFLQGYVRCPIPLHQNTQFLRWIWHVKSTLCYRCFVACVNYSVFQWFSRISVPSLVKRHIIIRFYNDLYASQNHRKNAYKKHVHIAVKTNRFVKVTLETHIFV